MSEDFARLRSITLEGGKKRGKVRFEVAPNELRKKKEKGKKKNKKENRPTTKDRPPSPASSSSSSSSSINKSRKSQGKERKAFSYSHGKIMFDSRHDRAKKLEKDDEILIDANSDVGIIATAASAAFML